MEFRTYKDLNQGILSHLSELPQDIDLIVGIPRSGLMLATMIALYLNLPITSLDDFLDKRVFASGSTKPKKGWIHNLDEARKILIVEDSVASGHSILEAKAKIQEQSPYADRCLFLAAYVQKSSASLVDFYFEILEQPRIFQWNFLQHTFLGASCFDIDGVLCEDPTPEQNDDGEKYRDFLLNAPLKLHPCRPVRWLVTSRLEKYRSETEAWLKKNHIEYDKLIMMNVATAEERRRLGNHAAFKAKYYASFKDAQLFVESEDAQAREIFARTNKPVFCIESQNYYCDKNREQHIAQVALRNHRIKTFLKKFRIVRYLNKYRKKYQKRREMEELENGR